MRLVFALALLLTAATTLACGNIVSRKYEYEEEMYLALDGSATVYVNASVPALVALRGAVLPVDPHARLDRRVVGALFESPVSHVANLSTSRRDNRRYVHVRIDVPDIRRLNQAAPFSWSAYTFEQRGDVFEYGQRVSAASAREVGNVGWTGGELVAFRLHLPSRVPSHNAPSRSIERGNIVVWEQALADRLKGAPVDIQVRMESESILFRTLVLFGLMMAAVAATFAGFIWFVRSRGREDGPQKH